MRNVYDEKKMKLEHLENMVAVAMVDGSFQEEEKVFLKDKAIEFGLSVEEITHVLKNVDLLQASASKTESNFSIPKNKINKEEQLADAVYMSLIDGEVSSEEYALCLHLAYKLDYEQKDVDEIINLTIKLCKQY